MGNPRPEPRKAALWRGSVLDVRMSGCVEVGRERGSQACGRSAADFFRRTFFPLHKSKRQERLASVVFVVVVGGNKCSSFFPTACSCSVGQRRSFHIVQRTSLKSTAIFGRIRN